MAVLEAMARGMCVIASDVGGVPEMIGGGCGVIVEPYDLEAIQAALRLAVTTMICGPNTVPQPTREPRTNSTSVSSGASSTPSTVRCRGPASIRGRVAS